MIWEYFQPTDSLSNLQAALNCSVAFAELLYKIGLGEPQEAISFLNPKLSNIDDPFKLKNLELVIERIIKAIEKKESVCIIGDYDVDGVTSSALLVSILRYFKLNPRYFVPRRFNEGYGLSLAILERVLEDNIPDLIIALDCGTNSIEEVDFLTKKNIDVIIIDHHKSKQNIPSNCLLINPHIFGDGEGESKYLCTVGLVFKTVHGLVKKLKTSNDILASNIRLSDYLDLVAMGTVADLVALKGENRIFTYYGLQKISKAERPGVKALLEVSGLSPGDTIIPVDISFKLGPRINASGRLADAVLPVEMLLGNDYQTCLSIAHELNDMNRERQEIEKSVSDEVQLVIDQEFSKDAGIIVFNENWHSGVVGIVAGKLTRKYHRPSIVLGLEDNLAKGSGRSIEGLNLVEILSECQEFLFAWGGHPMAVGISLAPENVPGFRKAFNQAIEKRTATHPINPKIRIASWICLSDIQGEFIDEIYQLMPFGEGNPEPILGLKKIILNFMPEFFGDGHFRVSIPIPTSQKWLSIVAWKQAHNIIPTNTAVDIAIKLRWNIWNGRKSIQAELIDWRLSIDS